MVYVFSKKVDEALIKAGGKKQEETFWQRSREWVEHDSAYLREFRGDGHWAEGQIKKVQKSYFSFMDGGIHVLCIGKGQAKVSSITGDEMEIDTGELVSSIEEILDLFDTSALRDALKAKELEAEAKAEAARKAAEEAEVKRAKKEKMKTLVEEAFTRIRKGEVSYIKGDFKFEVFGNIVASQRPIKRGITIQKQRLGSFERAEDRCWDPDTVVYVEDTADFRRAAIDPQEWFPEEVATLEEFYEYIISY